MPQMPGGGRTGREKKRAVRKGLPVPVMGKKGSARTKKASSYLVKSSGTTKGEVQGVLKNLKTGKMSKGGAIKALKGGPSAGVVAGNKKKVAKAIKTLRKTTYRAK